MNDAPAVRKFHKYRFRFRNTNFHRPASFRTYSLGTHSTLVFCLRIVVETPSLNSGDNILQNLWILTYHGNQLFAAFGVDIGYWSGCDVETP
ncbi:hypothetical protein CDAR_109781 [Caerostris darwini]|uniref:Uncharacterized protein n=1 Tax=Caerostris darwini TaxID=1538125 RepID=A0AAV4SW69_9ARAC|nr:hypothetical protein CDAR_109781 [Caerostris darwini]